MAQYFNPYSWLFWPTVHYHRTNAVLPLILPTVQPVFIEDMYRLSPPSPTIADAIPPHAIPIVAVNMTLQVEDDEPALHADPPEVAASDADVTESGAVGGRTADEAEDKVVFE